MDVLEVWGDSRLCRMAADDQVPLPERGIYIFLISFAGVYYLSNADLLLGHYDLGWHLAAGDLIRDRGAVPFQDPWSFTLADKQWYNLSWLWDVIASVLFQYTGFGGLVLSVVACGAVIVGYLTSLCLSRGASAIAVCISVFLACLLYPSFVTPPNIYLAASPNTATMLFCVVFYGECLRRTRWFLLPADDGALGQSARRLHDRVFRCRRFWRRGVAQARLGGFQDLRLAGAGCLVAIFVNPLGWHIYDGVTATLGHFVQANITEWQSYYQNMTMPGSIPGIAYVLISLRSNCAAGAHVPFRWSHGCCPGCFCCLGSINSDICPFSFCSRQSRWRFTSIGCCPSG